MGNHRLPFHVTYRPDKPLRIEFGGVDISEHVTYADAVIDTERGIAEATIRVPATVEWEAPMHVTVVRDGALFLENLTSEELDAVLASGSMASSPGARILAHLQARAGMTPQ